MTSADDPRWHIHDAPPQQPQTPSSPDRLMTSPKLVRDIDLINHLGHVSKDLDQLVHWLDAKPIFQDSLRRHFEETAAGEVEQKEEGGRIEGREFPSRGRITFFKQTSTQSRPSEFPPALDSQLSTQCPPYPSTISLRDPFQPSGLCEPETQVINTPFEDKYPHNASDFEQPRWSKDTRLRSASNTRTLDLVTDMIENGVQCNVQNSTPSSPTRKWSASSVLSASNQHFNSQNAIDHHLTPNSLELEVDIATSKPDDEMPFNDNMTLRLVSCPAGIRKLGFLRYRSSAEAAQSCKTMKKNVPRMRRRGRTTSTVPPAEP